MKRKYKVLVWCLGIAFALGMAGCRIDHYAWVRVLVKDADTGESITNAPCRVSCGFPCFDLDRMFSWDGQRTSASSENVDTDNGVAWVFGHGNTGEACAWLETPPNGYFCVHDYLDHVKHYPPLIRFSLGYHNTSENIDKTISAIDKIR